MNKQLIEVPYGIRYISEWKEYNFPENHCIVDKGVTGCGYTEYCLMNNLNIVLCSPRKMLLESKSRKHKDDLNIRYIENTISDFEDTKSFETKVKDHVENCQIVFNQPCKILVTYDSCYRVVKALRDLNVLDQFYFVVDEFQSIFLDSYFKSEVELDFVNALHGCSNVLYLSATPMLEKYLDKLPEFSSLLMYELDWSKTGYTERVLVQRKQVSSLTTECNEIIQNYKENSFPVTLDNSGTVFYSTEAIFYFNSISDITKVIKKNKLTPSEVNILCSKSEDTKKKLDKLSNDLGYSKSSGLQRFEVGVVPLKGEPNKMFTFCTSAVYMGIDLHSDCASTYVFADPNISCLALDISLDLPQIAGRLRDDENPFKNIINLFYKTKRKDYNFSYEEFKNLQDQRRDSTKELLSIFNKCTESERSEYLLKLKDSIKVSQYSRDFVSISKTTNQPVYNYLIDIANERAWEVSQKDYQDKISVTKSLSEEGFYVGEYKTENDRIASDFLDNHFYQTGIFREKLRMYCEFVDIHRDNLEIMNILNHRITNLRFKQFYNYFGTKGCSSRGYEEKPLLEAWSNDSKEDKLVKEIYFSFKPGDRFSAKELKILLSKIYKKLEITRTAKATDLKKYFKLTKTCITLPDKTVVNGFKLEKL